MRQPRIFTDQPLQQGLRLELESGASRHVARVLRMSAGAALSLFNGESDEEFSAVLSAVNKNRVEVTVGESVARSLESPLRIHLGIGLSRGERMDWVVQKATELGVHALTPLYSERTEIKLNAERLAKKVLHWRQIAISACEQCGRNRPPQVGPPQALTSWLASCDQDCRIVLHPGEARTATAASPPHTIALLVGPEGGLSDAEISLAEAADFDRITLGPRVLRTETAPLAALAILQARWGDMSVPS